MGKRKIKTHPKENKPVIQEPNIKKFWITSVSIVVGIILLVFLINYQMVPYWFGKTDPIAKVNGKPIYSKEAKADLILTGIAYKSIVGSSIWNDSPSDFQGIKSSVLDDLIKIHVQLQEAEKEGIRLTDKEMASTVKSFNTDYATMKSSNGDEINTGLQKLSLSEDTLKLEDKQSTIDNSIIDKLKQNILMKDYIKTLSNKDLDRITVREIYIDFQNHPQVKAKKLIDEIYGKLKAGSKFNDLVKEYKKDDFNAENNGLIGTIGRGIMPAEFDKVAFSLKIGQISAPVKTKLGYHIILVDKSTNGDVHNIPKTVISDISTSDKFTAFYNLQVDKWVKKASTKKFVPDFK